MKTELGERISEANASFDAFIQTAEKQQARCPLSGVCGGCSFQHVPLELQTQAKKEFLEQLFPSLFKKFHPAPSQYFYRNKMDYACSHGSIGMRKKNSFSLVADASECFISGEKSNNLLRAIKQKLTQRAVKDYDFTSHEGFLRYVVLREAKNEESALINFVTSASEEKNSEENSKLSSIALELREEFPFASIAFSENNGQSDVSRGRIYKVFKSDFYEEKTCGKKFRVPANAFFQTNPLQAEKLFEKINSLVEKNSSILDAFCGVGTIGIIASDKASEVAGVELEEESIRTANVNAELNSVKNASFFAGDARIAMKQLLAQEKKFDHVILDPPRSGLSKKVIMRASMLASQSIIYSSCNPATQARDFEWFAEHGFAPEWVEAWDFFPNTRHVETLSLLTRK
ncbi:23S rRNA (uracil(1939)-C(5))-methyltransferase RlmD [Candidatus Micrarchaeota archaeon]|nr:23S rRNA (uracil(1939)-C(5))-methyltransferase RlmD [Candidatus Micrarchaeota archaeon]